MGAGETENTIATAAMTLIGANPVPDIDDEDVNEAVICKRLLPTLRWNLLSRYPWRFAMAFIQLSREASNPDGPWTYAYAPLPADRLKDTAYRLFASSNDGTPTTRAYEDRGGKIYSNHDELWMEYTKDVAAPTTWPPYFSQLMKYALAEEAAFPITRDEQLRDSLHARVYGVGGIFQDAKTADSIDRPPRIVQDSTLLEARFGGITSFTSPWYG